MTISTVHKNRDDSFHLCVCDNISGCCFISRYLFSINIVTSLSLSISTAQVCPYVGGELYGERGREGGREGEGGGEGGRGREGGREEERDETDVSKVTQ